MKNRSSFVAATAWSLAIAAVGAVAQADPVTWQGITWQEKGNGSAVVDGDTLTLTPDSDDEYGITVQNIGTSGTALNGINVNQTPWVQLSYIDPGERPYKVGIFVDEEVENEPRINAGSRYGAAQAAATTFGQGPDRENNERYIFYSDPDLGSMLPANDDRAPSREHTVRLDKLADGSVAVTFDGEQRYSPTDGTGGTSLQDGYGPWTFENVLVRARDAGNTPIVFTDFEFGDNAAVPTPAAGALGLVGFGLLALRRRRRNETV